MKNRTILSLSSLAVMLTAVFAISTTGCKKNFDNPDPLADTLNLPTATHTIMALKTQYPTVSGQMTLITDDIVIRGVVVGNDRTGNIYKVMYIQDATAGIQIDIEATGLYNIMPVGREVFILCKGLYIANNNNMIKLATRVVENGSPVAGGIRQIYLDSYIKRGRLNQKIDTVIVSNVSMLNNNHQAMLVKFSNFEVAPADLTKTYADTSVNKANTNITLQSCGGQSIIMRSSGYANFAAVPVPQGNGTVTAIYTVFNTTKQLVIRDTSDLKLYGPRGSCPPPVVTYKTIQEIRALGDGGIIPANTGIRGTIVSSTANEAAGNYRIQDGSGYGIQIRFPVGGNPGYLLNDSVAMDISNLLVEKFPAGNGDLQINNVGSSAKIGIGNVTPRSTTTALIGANINDWASTVVTLNNVTITAGAPTSSGINYTITDASGSIVTHIRNSLGYVPPATATSITGYVSIFGGTPQLTLRAPSDVVAGALTIPTLTTNAVTGITQTTATSGGNVTAQGTSAVTARGVVWSTSPSPTVALSTKTTDGSGTGVFVSSITGLTANTVYYVRAYATNASGTAYGNEVTFTSQSSTGGSVITETFETGTKGSYTAASVTLSSGSWMFSDAVIGGEANDKKNGAKAARIRGQAGSNNGFIETEFTVTGLQTVTVMHAQTNFFEGTGTLTVSFEVQVSKNGGAWTKVGATVNPTATLASAVFNVNAAAGENVKVRILNTSGASIQTPANQVRINIDDVKLEQ